MNEIHDHTTCRVCDGRLLPILDLGTLHLNDFPAHPGEIAKVPKVPHTLCVCTSCSLAQLQHTVPPDWMYRTYHYRSGVNEMMVRELQDVVAHVRRLVPLAAGDYVLDIGANDGTLLAAYTTGGYPPRRCAVEPALNLHAKLGAHCEQLSGDYFPSTAYDSLVGQFKVITAIAMCYDLEDPLTFFSKIRHLLHPDGVVVVQFQDMGQMIQSTAFDNICPEHLEYYTLGTLQGIVRQAGLEVTECHTRQVNGGSLRVILRHAAGMMRHDWEVHQSVYAQRKLELHQGLDTEYISGGRFEAFYGFAARVSHAQEQIRGLIDCLNDQATVVDVYGASTKGNVLLQVLGITPANIRQAIDRSPDKVGLYTITGIPIVSEEEARGLPANVWLTPIWQFRPSVLARNGWYLDGGGQIIFPLPNVEVVERSWERQR